MDHSYHKEELFCFKCLCCLFLIRTAFELASDVKVKNLMKPDCSAGLPQGQCVWCISHQVTTEWGRRTSVLSFLCALVDECRCSLCTSHLL